MDKFEVESVSYTNAITSAPSSVMAAASMFTGMESAYLARNYNDWEFDTSNIISLQNTLEDNGYEIFSIDNSTSASVNPPSGPTNNATDEGLLC